MSAPSRPCADPCCGHDKRAHVHARGCFATTRALGQVIRVPAYCPCPGYFDALPLNAQTPPPAHEDDDDDWPRRPHEAYRGAYETRVA